MLTKICLGTVQDTVKLLKDGVRVERVMSSRVVGGQVPCCWVAKVSHCYSRPKALRATPHHRQMTRFH